MNRTEEEYRILAEESQHKFLDMDLKLKKEREKVLECHKLIAVCYTYLKSADDILEEVTSGYSDEEMMNQSWVRDLMVVLERGRYYASEGLISNVYKNEDAG